MGADKYSSIVQAGGRDNDLSRWGHQVMITLYTNYELVVMADIQVSLALMDPPSHGRFKEMNEPEAEMMDPSSSFSRGI